MIPLIEFCFALWGLYRGFWVVRKVYRWCARKLAEHRAEQIYINQMAAYVRLYGPNR